MTTSFEMLQPPEPEVMSALTKFWGSSRHFVDIGASYGEFTTAAMAVMEGGRIDAIEPDENRIASLNRQVAHNQKTNASVQIKTHHCAISNRNEQIAFCKPASATISGRLDGIESHKTPTGDKLPASVTYVPAKTLDSLFSNTPPDLIKMDIEGAEGNALLGATNILQARQTVWVIELHDYTGGWTPLQVTQYMRVNGYRTTLLMPARFLFTPDTLRSRPLWYARKTIQKIQRTLKRKKAPASA